MRAVETRQSRAGSGHGREWGAVDGSSQLTGRSGRLSLGPGDGGVGVASS